ncbi:MAG: type II toxin-antitoxin system MqsA family antitoxin [Candidatus Binatia bacterium]
MKNEQCPICGGNLKEELITHEERDESGTLYIFENVPALVCEECGDYLLTDEVVKRLDQLIQKNEPVRTVETLVYDFTS